MTQHSRRKMLLAASATGALATLPVVALAQAKKAEAAKGAAGKLRVAAIYTVPVEQQWVSRIHKALNAEVAAGGIEYVFSESVANADYERVMRQYAEAKHDFIIGESFAVEAAARKVAREYPKIAFLMGSSGKPQEPNFSVFDNYIQEPAYLTGLLAGGMSKTNKIGMVGGFPIPEVNRLMHAFMTGAREVNPKVEFMVTFINSWFDPPKAKEAAFAMIDKGADVMYAERFGVSDAAKERKVLAIGNVIDTQAQYPDTVIASALWHMEPTVQQALKNIRAGKFTPEDYGKWSHMPVGGSSLSPLGTFEKRVPQALVKRVREREAAIMAGKFVVKVDDSQPKSTAK